MSTAVAGSLSLCDYCRRRPKYYGHPYCGKTCATAAQAGTRRATLRNHRIRLKPSGHDYRDKTPSSGGWQSQSFALCCIVC
ncbi:hypothetical protein B0H21DRAFT_750081 [Amylocystis lapponica]|nr:hypothetical protein B0H21DRAFT_750081 [Amylocystis lapponica]